MSRNSKTVILTLSFVLCTLFTTAAMAQAAGAAAQQPASPAPSGPPPTKIGVVNIQDAIASTNEGKKEIEGLQARFSPKQVELKNLNDEVENLKKQFQAQSDKLSEEERNNRLKTIDLKQKALTRNAEDAQNDYQQATQEMVNRIGTKMLQVLEKYGKANGYAVVLDVSNPNTPVLWASEASSMQKELVEAYNAEYPVAAPAPKAAGTAPRPAAPSAPTPKKP